VFDDPTPVNVGNPGCPAMARYGHGQWTSCGAKPEVAGYLTVSSTFRLTVDGS
jgi:hypothetical protein